MPSKHRSELFYRSAAELIGEGSENEKSAIMSFFRSVSSVENLPKFAQPSAKCFWIEDESKAMQLARLFVRSADPDYISHGEILSGRALSAEEWDKDLALKISEEFSKAVAAWKNDRSMGLVGIEIEGKLSGLALVEVKRPDGAPVFAILHDLVLTKSRRNGGFGSAFMSWFEKELSSKGIRRVILESGVKNKKAHGFFERLGYRQVSLSMLHDIPAPISEKTNEMPEWRLVADTYELREAYESCERSIPAFELDPWEWWLDEWIRTLAGRHQNPYTCLICRKGGRVIGGITWNSYSIRGMTTIAIGFIWVEPELRHLGLGREAFETCAKLAREETEKARRQLWGFILESNVGNGGIEDSRPFWMKLGFNIIPESQYVLPGLKFDPKTGLQSDSDIELSLMVRIENTQQGSKFLIWLEQFVRIMYFDWYGPQEEEFESWEAYRKACEHVERKFEDFRRSLEG